MFSIVKLIGLIRILTPLQENASERARKIFGELDVNGDGELDCEEFVKGCMEDKDLLQTLNGGDVKAQDGQRKEEVQTIKLIYSLNCDLLVTSSVINYTSVFNHSCCVC